MWHGFTAVFLVGLLVLPAPVALARSSQQEKQATIQEKVLDIPAGSVVEVRLKTKEKIRGQLGQATADGFSVKLAKGASIEDRTFAFEEVKSIKMVEKGMSTAAKIGLGALAGAGVVFLVILAIVAGANS